MTYVIGVTGAHSTGKTTMVGRITDLVRQMYPNARIGVLSEVARQCPLKNKKDGPRLTQMSILGKQIEEEAHYRALCDIVIMDRTLIDVAAYTDWYLGEGIGRATVWSIAWEMPYDLIYLTTLDSEQPCEDDGERSTDEEMREYIDQRCFYLTHKLYSPQRVQTLRPIQKEAEEL